MVQDSAEILQELLTHPSFLCEDAIVQQLVANGKALSLCAEQWSGLPIPRPPAGFHGGQAEAFWAGSSRRITGEADGSDEGDPERWESHLWFTRTMGPSSMAIGVIFRATMGPWVLLRPPFHAILDPDDRWAVVPYRCEPGAPP